MERTGSLEEESLDPALFAWLADKGVGAVWAALEAAGGQTRAVGGAVRDALLGRASEDVDFATTLPPEAAMQALAQAGLKAVPTGIKHGTVTAVAEGKGFEITTLRHDVETNGRHAQIAYTDDFAADAARRDFTFNALYLDRAGRLYDYTGGQADLKAGILRFIGDPRARIREDVLRLLRFFRFFAQLETKQGPLTPEAESLAACYELAPLIPQLSAERVWKEISRLLVARDPVPALTLMAQGGVLKEVLPEADKDFTRLARLIVVMSENGLPADPVRRLAAIVSSGHSAIAQRLRLSREQGDRLVALAAPPHLRAGDQRGLAQHLYDLGPRALRDAALLQAAAGDAALRAKMPELLAFAAAWRRPVFPLQGRDLLLEGFAAGPQLGAALAATENWWRGEDFRPDRKACLAYAGEMARK